MLDHFSHGRRKELIKTAPCTSILHLDIDQLVAGSQLHVMILESLVEHASNTKCLIALFHFGRTKLVKAGLASSKSSILVFQHSNKVANAKELFDESMNDCPE